MHRLRTFLPEAVRVLAANRRGLAIGAGAAMAAVAAAGVGISLLVLRPMERGVLPLPAAEFVQGEFLVKFRPGAPTGEINSLNTDSQADEIDRIPQVEVAQMRVPTGSSVGEMVNFYKRNPNVLYAEPNCRVAGGISAPGSHRSGREPLGSSGSCHPT